MMPTFDFVNLVKRAVKAALASVTGRVAAAITFAVTLTSLFNALGLDNLLYRFIPWYGNWQSFVMTAMPLHSELGRLLGYSVALEYAMRLITRAVALFHWSLINIPVFFVALVPSIWLVQVLRGTRKDVSDAIS